MELEELCLPIHDAGGAKLGEVVVRVIIAGTKDAPACRYCHGKGLLDDGFSICFECDSDIISP